MKKLVLVIGLGLAFTFYSDTQSHAGGVHVAKDWTGAYVPAKLQSDNVRAGYHVAASWADAYVPQQLQSENDYRGGYVATNWADAYVVQQLRNSDKPASSNKGS